MQIFLEGGAQLQPKQFNTGINIPDGKGTVISAFYSQEILITGCSQTI